MRDKKSTPNTQILSPAAEQAQRKLKMRQAMTDALDPERIKLEDQMYAISADAEMRRLKSLIAVGFNREEAMDLLVAESSRR